MQKRSFARKSCSILMFAIALGGASRAGGDTTPPSCPADLTHQAFAPDNPEFLGVVANEMMIPIALHANVAYLAQQYRQAGVGHSRVMLSWMTIQPSPPGATPGYDWGYADLQVAAMANSGLRTLGIIGGTPNWASSCPGSELPNIPFHRCLPAWDHWGDYENFVGAVVQRYGPNGTGQIRDWEIRIENSAKPNNIDAQGYVIELNEAYAVIHSADPGARVWAPEIAYLPSPTQYADAQAFADYVMVNGDFDIFSIHIFPSWDTPDIPEFVRAKAEWTRKQLDVRGLIGTPLAVTAMNVQVDPVNHPSNETEQAGNLQDMYTCAWAGGADSAMWFAGTQWRANTREIPCDQGYGIFNYESATHPDGPWLLCAPPMPTPPNPNKLEPRAAYATLQALGTAVVSPLPSGAPYGLLGVSSNPCNLSLHSPCPATLYWYSTNIAQAKVQLWWNGALKVCWDSNTEGSKPITFNAVASRHYEMYAAPDCNNLAPIGNRLADLVVSSTN